MARELQLAQASSIFVAGHRGLVGSAIVRRLETLGCHNVLVRTHSELDLREQQAINHFFREYRPEFVFLAAAKVGGILANLTRPAEFLRDNLAIQTNFIHAAWTHGAKKLLFLGSSCIYPRLAPQPLKEEHLLTGPLEAPTKLMKSPRLPDSSSQRRTAPSMDSQPSASCRRTCTARETTSIWNPGTSFPQ